MTYQNKKLAVRALRALRGTAPSSRDVLYYDHGRRKTDPDNNCAEAGIIDLLTDLRHLCDSLNFDFAEFDRQAYRHYSAELHGLD